MRRLQVLDSRSSLREGVPPRPADFDVSNLRDTQGREYSYFRISVTDRCDLACVYCMPLGGEEEHAVRSDLLTFEEIARLSRVGVSLGVKRIRFTGGEPLVRKDVVDLVAQSHRAAPSAELVMTTNAMRLAELARPLRRGGLSGVNVSIDSLDPARFARLTRGGHLPTVLAGVNAALDAGLDVKLNAVVLRGENEHELCDLVDFAWGLGTTMRFIELMPIGEGAKIGDQFVSVREMMERLQSRICVDRLEPKGAHGPARYHAAVDGTGRRVGFITAVTEEFCGACNRIRINSQGDVRACLANRRAVSLRDLMRTNASDADLAWALHWAVSGKSRGHAFTDEQVHEHEHIGMSLIGG